MTIRSYLLLAAALLGGAALAACGKIEAITQPAAQSGSANFSHYVSMGTSITAGWESGGLVAHHQTRSYAYLFAQQAGSSAFTIPSVSADGVPPLLRLLSLNPLIITNAGRTPGSWTNLTQPTSYHNMAVPYAIVVDAVDSTNYYVGPNPERITMFDNIVRHRGTIVQQVVSKAPTFISIEYGSNEVLRAATSGSGTPLLSPAQFDGVYISMLTALRGLAPQAKLALVTVPDVTTIPFFTTFSPITLDAATRSIPMPLVGPSGSLAPADLVLLRAADSLAVGTGIPVGGYNYVNPPVPGNGRPLLGSQVLDAIESAQIQSVVAAYNTTIRTRATAADAIVDLNGLLHEAATTGLRYQGHTYTTDFITGGLFSLDGVHPTDLAHGFLANLMIDAVNAKYGAHIPHVDLSQSATASSSRLQPANESKPMPWIQGADRLCPIVMPGDVIASN